MTNKYNARKTEIDGITFDSLAEGKRYGELKLMYNNGDIDRLQVHPRYVIWEGIDPKGKKQKIEYEGDFTYIENGAQVVEDVKGVLTAVFRLKKKMFTCRYPDIKFVEINERRRDRSQ
jgi:hypothetical protein